MYYFLFDVFPKPQSNTTDTFTPSEIAFLYVFRSLWSNLKNLSKCLKSRILRYFSDVVVSHSPHVYTRRAKLVGVLAPPSPSYYVRHVGDIFSLRSNNVTTMSDLAYLR